MNRERIGTVLLYVCTILLFGYLFAEYRIRSVIPKGDIEEIGSERYIVNTDSIVMPKATESDSKYANDNPSDDDDDQHIPPGKRRINRLRK